MFFFLKKNRKRRCPKAFSPESNSLKNDPGKVNSNDFGVLRFAVNFLEWNRGIHYMKV